MKLIIAGSRTLSPSIPDISGYIDSIPSRPLMTDLEVICGGVDGVDKCGADWAEYCHHPVRRFNAQCKKYGPKRAGLVRNFYMTDYADALLLIWDGKSKGSAHMKRCMLKLGKPVWEVVI